MGKVPLHFENDPKEQEMVANVFGLVSAQAFKDPSVWGQKLLGLGEVAGCNMHDVYPTMAFKIHTQDWMKNLMGAVHGGCVVTMVDNYTTWALLSDARYWKTFDPAKENYTDILTAVVDEFGVSRNLNVTFLRPVPIDADILLICRIQSNSTRYTHITFEILDCNTGKQLATGSHDKAKTNAKSKM